MQNAYNVKANSLSSDNARCLSYYNILKRTADIALSIIGIIIALPIIAIAALLIMLESKGGWLFKQQRVGKDDSIFTIYKLRTMYINTDEIWTEKDDPRITRIGRFIRKRRIDELPQLINVLRGEMSLIGPRPERPIYESAIAKELPIFKERLKVKPGITGWAQVNGGYNISNYEKLKMDLYYIQNKSFMMDIRIIVMTIAIVITTKGAR